MNLVLERMYFDSHCHLTDERFDEDRDEVLRRAREDAVEGIVSIASDAEDACRAIALAEGRPDVWATAGIHPHVCGDADPGDLERIADLARSHGKVVAVGETGLDYHYDNSPREAQRRFFRRHVDLAVELELPVIVHTRDADADTRALVREVGDEVRGVLHCYTGGSGLLEEALAADWYVSYSGIASFGSFDGEGGVRSVPGDRLLVETDAPYLAPHPVRGRRNEPSFVVHVAAAVAAIRGEEPEDLGRNTATNARRFYGIEVAEGSPPGAG